MSRPLFTTGTRSTRRGLRSRLGAVTALSAAIGFGALAALSPGVGAATPSSAVKVVVLTNASNGTTTLVTKGEEVKVQLHTNGYRWTEASVVNASPVAVLQKISGHVSLDGASTTTFLVVGYGSASLRAVGNPNCLQHGCALPSILWTANVVSPVIDPPGPAAA
jgi:hypothetical protein